MLGRYRCYQDGVGVGSMIMVSASIPASSSVESIAVGVVGSSQYLGPRRETNDVRPTGGV